MGRIKPSRVNSTRRRSRDRALGTHLYMPTYQEARLPGMAGAMARVKAEMQRRSAIVRRSTDSGAPEATEARST